MASRGAAKEALATVVTPVAPGFIVNRDLTILEFLGHTAPYVELVPGPAGLQLQKVVHPLLRKSVVEAARKVLDTGGPFHLQGVSFHRDGVAQAVSIKALPTTRPNNEDPCVEIRFEETAAVKGRLEHAATSQPLSQPDSVEARGKDLQGEVDQLRRQLGEAASACDEAQRSFASRLGAVEEEYEKSLAELKRTNAELEAQRKELQIGLSDKEEVRLQAREQRDFIEAVLDAAEALVIVVDRQGRIVRFNAACERAAGRKFRAVRRSLLWNLIPVSQRSGVRRVFNELVSGLFPNRFENDWVRKDGTYVRVSWSNTALTDAEGVVTHVIGIGIDVTERRTAQAALIDSEARNRALVEAAPLGVVVVDGAGRIRAVNTGLEQMFGYDRTELVGQPLEVLLPARFRKAHRQHRRRFFEHPMSRPMGAGMALFGRHKNGGAFPIEVGLGHFEASGGPSAVAFVTDVSAKVQAQRTIERDRNEIRDLAARLMKAREEEQSRIARELHDGLVQQLVALKLDLALLARKPQMAEAGLREDILQAVAQTGEAAENARAISHELHPAALEQLGLVPALRANATQLRHAKGIDVRVLANDPIPTVPRDVALGLYRIAQEALWNAANHSGSDRVTIALQTKRDQLTLEVRDSGRGFDFDKVRRGQSLGLVSMEERARLIHADLTVESRPGEGTTIRATLKLEGTG